MPAHYGPSRRRFLPEAFGYAFPAHLDGTLALRGHLALERLARQGRPHVHHGGGADQLRLPGVERDQGHEPGKLPQGAPRGVRGRAPLTLP